MRMTTRAPQKPHKRVSPPEPCRIPGCDRAALNPLVSVCRPCWLAYKEGAIVGIEYGIHEISGGLPGLRSAMAMELEDLRYHGYAYTLEDGVTEPPPLPPDTPAGKETASTGIEPGPPDPEGE